MAFLTERRRSIYRSLVVGVVLATVCAALGGAARVQSQGRVDEFQVKAAFLYNFAKFVQWPAGGDPQALVIGVVEDDAFADVLTQTVKGRNVNGRPIKVQQLLRDEDVSACDIVFIAEGSRRAGGVLKNTAAGRVLVVGDSPRLLRDGGHIRFFVEQNRVRFQISVENAERAGLKISSQLITLATQ